MVDPKAQLERLARAVADGTPVDWDAELEQAGPESTPAVQRLRLVERIGSTHASLRDEPPTDVVVTPDSPEVLETSDVVDPDRTPERWGPLRIVGSLGRGGYGDVFRAYDPALETHVALKLLHRSPEGRTPDEFLAEARKLARVRHEHVVTVHGAAEHDGRVGLWTELLEGKTLDELIAADGPLAAREAAAIGVDLCRALAAVHGAGVVHRDVKAANVIRETGGRIVLLDFSAGTELDADDGATISGTPQYMAPELFRREDSGTAVDFYSLGVLLYRLVTGRYPTAASGMQALIRAHEEGSYVRLLDARPDLPAAFVRAVERALEPDPARRYRTAAEMEAELAAAIGPAPAPVPADRDDERRPVWRRPGRWALAAAALVAVAAVGVWIARAVAPFDIDASWLRLRDDGVEERLRAGALVGVGDCLVLELESNRPIHVYVMNEDGRGSTSGLFPHPAVDLANPLVGDVRHRLPGRVAGRVECWNVDDAAGAQESMIVVASLSPIADLETEIAALQRAAASPARAAAEADDGVRLRGISGRKPVPQPDPARLSGLVGSLSRDAGARQGVWVWELTLGRRTAGGETP